MRRTMYGPASTTADKPIMKLTTVPYLQPFSVRMRETTMF